MPQGFCWPTFMRVRVLYSWVTWGYVGAGHISPLHPTFMRVSVLFSWLAWNHLMEETMQLWSTWQWNSTWSCYNDLNGDDNDYLDDDGNDDLDNCGDGDDTDDLEKTKW